MKNLFKILLASLALSSVACASETVNMEKLRDLTLLMRVTDQVCPEVAGAAVYVGSEGHLAYDNALLSLKEDLQKSKTPEKFLQRSKSCLKDCTCQIYEGLEELFGKTQTSLLASVKKQSAAMTDKDYGRCQKQLKLSCSSKNIKQLVEDAKKSQKEEGT
jgi:hypothetical protein